MPEPGRRPSHVDRTRRYASRSRAGTLQEPERTPKAGTGSRDGFDGNTEAGLCLMPLNRLLRTLISKAGASLFLLDGCRIAMELAPFDHRRSSAGSIIAVQCLT
ncbi:MAG: hypothetical protein E5X37_29095 [Mesorhizobium sp.]|nr:MAG: hypothetical protein E5X37_29095 [Mesorhizobium sp.]